MRKLLMCSAMLTMFIVLSQSQAQEFDRELFKLFGAAQKVIRDNPAMLASNPGVQKELKMDEDQVKAIRVRDVNAFLCDLASCKISLKDFRTLRASVNVVATLARTKRGTSQARRKRQVKQAIQVAADDLCNTATICRKSYVHSAIIDAFEKGTLVGRRKSPKGHPPARQILADVVAEVADSQ